MEYKGLKCKYHTQIHIYTPKHNWECKGDFKYESQFGIN